METRKVETYMDLGTVKLEVEYTYYPKYKSNDIDIPDDEEHIIIDRILWNNVDIEDALTDKQLESIYDDIRKHVNDLKEASKE